MKAESALAWAAAGFHVFPCAGKVPLVQGGFRAATNDAGQILDWWSRWPDANIGCDPDKSGYWVLDVDPRHGGDASLAELERQHGQLPDTWRVRTPSGGLHLWFRGRAPSTAGRLGRGLDTRGGGSGYVLLPGSGTDAGRYEGEFTPPVCAPDWLVPRPALPAATLAAPSEIDEAAAIAQGWRIIAHTPGAVSGERNNRTFKLAGALRDQGVPQEAALAMLLDWDGTNAPSLGEAEVARTVASLYRGSKRPLGNAAPDPSPFTRAGDDGWHPMSSLLTREITPVQELLPLLERGIPTFLCGAGGVHKSRLALQWALQAGHEGAAVPVYVSCEDHIDEVTRRVQAISARMDWKASGVLWDRRGQDNTLAAMSEGDKSLTPFHAAMVEKLQAIDGHKLVILDSCYDFARFIGRAKIDEGAVNYFVKDVLQGICDAADATLLVVWHPSSAGQDRHSMDGWSVAWHNAPRARLSLKHAKDMDGAVILETVKRNHAARQAPMYLEFDGGALVPARRTAISLDDDVRAVLADLDGQSYTVRDIVDGVTQRRGGLRASVSAVKAALVRLSSPVHP